MHITFLSSGSTGDVLPWVRLAQYAQTQGHQVRVAAPHNLAQLVQQAGIEYRQLRIDTEAVLAGPVGQALNEASRHPIQTLQALNQAGQALAEGSAEDVWNACEETDALVCYASIGMMGQTVAALKNIPFIQAYTFPMMPSREQLTAVFPLRVRWGGRFNHFIGRTLLWVLWRVFADEINQLRQTHGMPPQTWDHYWRELQQLPHLNAYSRFAAPKPSDWGANIGVTGYIFAPTATAPLSPALQAFIDAGEPPLYIGFGSMSYIPQVLSEILIAALQQTGQRAIVQSVWGEHLVAASSERIFALHEFFPYEQLFPQVAGAVHHGGSGTVAYSLLTGTPTLIIPHLVDQPFWGERLHELGVGPAPIGRQRLTAASFAAALQDLAHNAKYRQHAQRIQAQVSSEDGLQQAYAFLQTHLQRADSKKRVNMPPITA